MQKLSRLFDVFGKYLIAAVIVIVPLFPKFPLINVPGTYVAIRFEDLILLLLGIITLGKIAFNLKTFMRDKVIRTILIFLGVGLVSVLSGVLITKTIGLSIGILNLARRIEYLVPFFAVLFLIPKEKFSEYLQFYLKLLVIDLIVIFVYGLGQRYFKFPVIITQNDQYSKGIALFWTPGSHINSTFAGHYDLAGFIDLIIPIFIALFFLYKDKITRLFILIASGFGLWLLINSLSRIGQVSYLLAVAIALILIKKFKALVAVLIISLFFIGMSSSLDARFQRIIQVIYEKVGISKTVSFIKKDFEVLAADVTIPARRGDAAIATPTPVPVFEDRSTSIRLNVEWPRAIRAFVKNPLLGTGYSSITLATDNDYLRALGETGILGFLSFGLIFLQIGRELIKSLPFKKDLSLTEKGFLAGVFGGIIGTLVTALFIDLFEASKFATIFWLIIGLALVAVRNNVYVKKT